MLFRSRVQIQSANLPVVLHLYHPNAIEIKIVLGNIINFFRAYHA